MSSEKVRQWRGLLLHQERTRLERDPRVSSLVYENFCGCISSIKEVKSLRICFDFSSSCPKRNQRALFSEDQVTRIVNAEVAKEKLQWQIEKERLDREREDSPPETVLIDRKIALAKFREMEKEILDKHRQAVVAWKKAYALYSDVLKKNPGSNIMNAPGKAPELGKGIENLRGTIRAYDCLTDEKMRIARSEWLQTFRDASQAIAEMRAIRDNYFTLVSGASVNLATMSNTGTNTFNVR